MLIHTSFQRHCPRGYPHGSPSPIRHNLYLFGQNQKVAKCICLVETKRSLSSLSALPAAPVADSDPPKSTVPHQCPLVKATMAPTRGCVVAHTNFQHRFRAICPRGWAFRASRRAVYGDEHTDDSLSVGGEGELGESTTCQGIRRARTRHAPCGQR